jgi:hypothetical protein
MPEAGSRLTDYAVACYDIYPRGFVSSPAAAHGEEFAGTRSIFPREEGRLSGVSGMSRKRQILGGVPVSVCRSGDVRVP